MRVLYTPRFIKSFKSLPRRIQLAAVKKESLLLKDVHDPRLCTHQLNGQLKNYYSFRINYSYRIIFAVESDESYTFIDIGTHSIYK